MSEEPLVEIFTTGPECHLCEVTKADLGALRKRYSFRLSTVDLREGPEQALRYALRAPVVHVDGELVAEGRIGIGELESALKARGVALRGAPKA